MHKKTNKGFTLVELLITMMIVAILAAISIFGLQGARESGRDAKRKADLESIRSALEIYRADCGNYPASLGTSITGACPGPAANTYMQAVPTDPLGGAYIYNRITLTSYRICSTLEQIPDPANDVSGCSGCSGGDCRYRVLNP
ncbi:prepilin-type N-terminal cleavage/methylation domain-containing protein [Candidatus Woesebacteria bacterium]|nr:MAG: prepilin-type N-terminal cleavage/methylation domain-containing protein [Candidatus Woesebacteria bacterium]